MSEQTKRKKLLERIKEDQNAKPKPINKARVPIQELAKSNKLLSTKVPPETVYRKKEIPNRPEFKYETGMPHFTGFGYTR